MQKKESELLSKIETEIINKINVLKKELEYNFKDNNLQLLIWKIFFHNEKLGQKVHRRY